MPKKQVTIPVFLPQIACQHACIYCNQRLSGSQEKIVRPDEVEILIKERLKVLPPNSDVDVAFFGGTFTALPMKVQQDYLSRVQPFIKNGQISSIRLSTRPDCINEENLSLLKENHVSAIELGAQSFSDSILSLSGRGHSVLDIENAAAMIKSAGFLLGLQLLPGLPGDSYELALYSAKRCVELKADEARIYPALVLKGTILESMMQQGKYQPLTLQQAIVWAAGQSGILENAGIRLLRVGLHPSEGLENGNSISAGPYHPAFKDLVRSFQWSEILKPLIEKPVSKTITLLTARSELGSAAGHHGSNRKILLNKYQKVNFRADNHYKGLNYGLLYS